MAVPDKKSVMMYLTCLYEKLAPFSSDTDVDLPLAPSAEGASLSHIPLRRTVPSTSSTYDLLSMESLPKRVTSLSASALPQQVLSCQGHALIDCAVASRSFCMTQCGSEMKFISIQTLRVFL